MGLEISEILLIVFLALLLFGPHRLRDLPRLSDLPREITKSIEAWRKESEGDRINPQAFRALITIAIGGVLFMAILTLALANIISSERIVVVMAVVLLWLITGFYCFGKRG